MSTVLFSCDKDDTVPQPLVVDYRDAIIGEYDGIRAFTDYNSVPAVFDTVSATITLSKSLSDDSIIDVTFSPHYINSDISIEYTNNELSPVPFMAQIAIATLTGDSIYYYHRPGQAPRWYEYFVNKVP